MCLLALCRFLSPGYIFPPNFVGSCYRCARHKHTKQTEKANTKLSEHHRSVTKTEFLVFRIYLYGILTGTRFLYNMCVCCMYYLSRLIGNAGLAVNVFEGLKDLCSSQISLHLFNLLQSLVHGLLTVLHTLTAIRNTQMEEVRWWMVVQRYQL